MSIALIWMRGIPGRRLVRLVLIVLIAAFSWQWGRAQTAVPGGQRLIDEFWTFKQGAPEAVRPFAQTTDGYLWVGAQAGLFRFDGVRFELFHSPFGDQLQSTNVSALFAPPTGGLWVGYLFGGFSFIRNGKVTNFAESTGTIRGFAQDSHGILWAATSPGLRRFDGSSWQHIGAEWNIPEKPVAQVGVDGDGILWVLSGGVEVGKQLFFLLPGDRQFRNAGDNLQVQSFTWDADHTVLTTHDPGQLGSGSGIELKGSLPAYPILRKNSEQVLDRANSIWFFPLADPFVLRHPAGEPLAEVVSNASPSNSEVYNINAQGSSTLVDREGSIWITDQPGIHRFSYSPVMEQKLPKWPGPFFSLAPDEDGVVWILAGDGEEASTLYRVADGKWTAEFQRSKGGVSNFAYRAPDKTLWFGGEGGLWHMVNGRLTRIDLPKEMADRASDLTTITQDRSGAMWVSFGRPGLYQLKDGVWTKYGGRSDLPTSGVVIEFTDTLGRIWFGCTKSHLAVLDGDRVQTFGPNDGIQVGNITAIYGRGSEIWIGGEFGLQQFDNGRFHTIHSVDRESLRGISGIVETANGDLWLNGLGGIVHVRRAEILEALKNPAYQVSGDRFDRRAGLPGLASQLRRIPSAIEGTDGRLWFAEIYGVVWLDPTRASNKIQPPPVSIQSVSADDKGYPVDLPLRFPARTSSVQISYAAVSLMDPEAIRFRYKVREIDKDWHEAGTATFVSYRNLPPGVYHFQVGACDTNGVWSGNAASAEFTILPAFYETNWFRALCALTFLAMLWTAYHLRVGALKRRQAVLERHQTEIRALNEQMVKAQEAERTRIAGELHDGVLQQITSLVLRLAKVKRQVPPDSEAKMTVSVLQQELIQVGADIRHISHELHPALLQEAGLPAALASYCEEFTKVRGLLVSCTTDENVKELSPGAALCLYRIAQEALGNASKYSAAKKVEVRLTRADGRVRLSVSDDGVGCDPNQTGKSGGLGVINMRERVLQLNGTFEFDSAPGRGTTVKVEVPFRPAA